MEMTSITLKTFSGMNLPDWITFITAIAAIIAAIIAAWSSIRISFYESRRRALDQIAANRQVWINNLRDELSAFLSLSDEDLVHHNKRYNENINKRALSQFKIQLLLNPSETSSQLLFSLFCPTKNFSFDTPSPKNQESDNKKNTYVNLKGDFITISQALLKIEWDRVKMELGGEPTHNEDYGDRFKETLELYLNANKKEVYEVDDNKNKDFESHKRDILNRFDTLKNTMSLQKGDPEYIKRYKELYKYLGSGSCSL